MNTTTCQICSTTVGWIECPTGGWWAHETHPDDDHDAVPAPVHCKRSTFDVYIGRPSKWGNPFAIGPDGSRAEVIEKYRVWLREQTELLGDLHELTGKVLGCWCAPNPCHGDLLAALVS